MRIDPPLEEDCLRILFQMDPSKVSLYQLLDKTLASVEKRFDYEDFDMRRTKIAVTTFRGLELYDDFTSMKDLIQCCRSSSFIPWVTYPDVFLFYKNRLSLDGGFHFKKVKKRKKKETLLISSSMFGRYKEGIGSGLRKPKCSYYQLYLHGYQDAKKNHAYFTPYFKDS